MAVVIIPAVLGTTFAVLAAFGWAGQYVCIRVGTEEGSVREAMIVAFGINVLLILPGVVFLYYPEYGLTFRSAIAFVIAGLTGSFLSRILQFKSTEAIGASLTASVVSTNALISAVLAVLFLGEGLSGLHFVGIVLIVGAVVVLSRETAEGRTASKNEAVSASAFSIPILAAVFLAIDPIFVKYGLELGTPPLVGLAIMVLTATGGYYTTLAWDSSLAMQKAFEANDRIWYLGAGILGTFSLVGYFAALMLSPVVVVVPIMQVAPLIVVGISAVLLPQRLEAVSWRLAAASTAIVCGSMIVVVAGQ
jgi:drug/metabolite transporter (DMT)-like permease